MKILLVTIGIIVFVALLPLIIGLFLPSEKSYTKTFTFNAPVDKVWNIVTDLKGQEKWRSDVKDIQIISNTKDSEIWIEQPKNGPSIKFQTKEKIENQLWVMEIIDNPTFSGKWVGTFEALGENRTKVVFTESPTIPNPYFRTFSLLFVDMDKTLDLYLENLARELGEKYVKKN